MATDFSVKDLKEKCARIRVTVPEQRMSLQHANIEWEGHQSAPIFTTNPLKLAGWGISIAKMGDPFPLTPSEKLNVPAQPDDELAEALSELTCAVAREIEKNKDKVRKTLPLLTVGETF